jgi:hypothetical protein
MWQPSPAALARLSMACCLGLSAKSVGKGRAPGPRGGRNWERAPLVAREGLKRSFV